jgi:sodium/hydrogen antiporter
MDLYIIMLTIIGLAALGMAWMPAISKKTGISYAIWYVLAGFILFACFDFFPNPNPLRKGEFALRLSELVVIVSLMGTGLKIDERFSFKRWSVPFRLVVITMILSIAAVTYFSMEYLGFALASALLLGAVLAPTDPVLAADVQVGPPHNKEENHVRFSLTAEAGMNDGMAFPFTWLAIALVASNTNEAVGDWLKMDVLYRIVVGLLSGFVIGRLLAWLLFYLPQKVDYAQVRDGFVAISATLLVYGLTEILHGYGFIAVFVAAVTLRNYEMDHKYHTKLHSFTDQIERILLAVVLILFGGSLASGILNSLSLSMVMFSLAFLFIIRPVTGLIGLMGAKLELKEKLAISFFGIRGVGSFFYLAFALNKADFTQADDLWAVTSFVVIVSILIHGTTAAIGMGKIEQFYEERKQE